MSKKNVSNNTVLRQFLNSSINYPSLKARLRFNEFKKSFTKLKYNNFFQKCNNLNSVTNSIFKKYTIKDLYGYEQKNSQLIHNEIHKIDRNLNIFEKKNQFYSNKIKNKRYKLKIINDCDYKTNRNKDDLIKSVKKDISKYLENLHLNNSSSMKNKNMRKNIFQNLKLNLSPLSENNKTKSVMINSFDNMNSFSNRSTNKTGYNNSIINKNKIKKFISIDENTEYINLLNNINENNNTKISKDNNDTTFKKFPALRQNSLFSKSNKKVTFQINNKNEELNSVNFPNIIL